MAESPNGRPENAREIIEALEPESILPSPIKAGKSADVLAALFRSRENLQFAGDRVPAWWSPERDKWLWKTLVGSDILQGAIFSTSARLSSTPCHVEARNPNSKVDRRIAHWSSLLLDYYWAEIALQVAIDWQSQDNGTFIEVMGAGEPGGPIEPTRVPGTKDYIYATGLRVLDAQMATRTKDPEYPVVYRHRGKDGAEKLYKFHYTRIIYAAQMPSTRRDMLGVGLSGASRCIRNILRLDDIGLLEDEMLGTRPISQMIFSRGISADKVEEAFHESEEIANLGGEDLKRRTARTVFLSVVGGPESMRAASIEMHDLKKLPEGYNPEVSMNLAMNVMAMSLGFDPREFWPATVRGATRADAEVQHWKAMRKTPGYWVTTFKRELERKFCPASAQVLFDGQDDEQDAARAALRKARADEIGVRLATRQWDRPMAFQAMLDAGDITEAQMTQLLASTEIQRFVDAEIEALTKGHATKLQTDTQLEIAKLAAAKKPAPGGENG